MTAIRRPLIALLAVFVGAVAFDRLGMSTGRTIETPAYLLAVVFVAAPLLVRGLRRSTTRTNVLLSLAGLLGLRSLTGTLITDPYQALVESAFVALAAALAHTAATGLERLDQTLGAVAFGESPALPLDGHTAANEILGEMARSRRHSRPLSVTVLAPDPVTMEAAIDAAAEDVQRAVRARFVHGKIAREIADQLRRSDLLFEDPATGHFVVVSPETGSDGATLLVERIRSAAAGDNVQFTSGHATFPDHALTFEQLVERAQTHMERAPERHTEPNMAGAA